VESAQGDGRTAPPPGLPRGRPPRTGATLLPMGECRRPLAECRVGRLRCRHPRRRATRAGHGRHSHRPAQAAFRGGRCCRLPGAARPPQGTRATCWRTPAFEAGSPVESTGVGLFTRRWAWRSRDRRWWDWPARSMRRSMRRRAATTAGAAATFVSVVKDASAQPTKTPLV